jgi:UDP-glucuronate decarboxylase
MKQLSAKVDAVNARVGDPKQRSPDISLAKKALSWEPQVALEQGLAKTITYFKDRSRC